MKFSDRLKGSLTQTLIKTLLQDSKYRIVPLGVEEVIREVAVLDKKDYKALKLPVAFKTLPDFFITNTKSSQSWLVEVKFRKEWSAATVKSLKGGLTLQTVTWHPLYLVVFLGKPGKNDGKLPSDSIGVVKLNINEKDRLNSSSPQEAELHIENADGTIEKRWNEVVWTDFKRVQDVFPGVSDKEKYKQGTLVQITSLLQPLARLSVFE